MSLNIAYLILKLHVWLSLAFDRVFGRWKNNLRRKRIEICGAERKRERGNQKYLLFNDILINDSIYGIFQMLDVSTCTVLVVVQGVVPSAVIHISYQMNFVKQICLTSNFKLYRISSHFSLEWRVSTPCMQIQGDCIVYIRITSSYLRHRQQQYTCSTLSTFVIMTVLVFEFAHSFYYYLIAFRKLVSPKLFHFFHVNVIIIAPHSLHHHHPFHWQSYSCAHVITDKLSTYDATQSNVITLYYVVNLLHLNAKMFIVTFCSSYYCCYPIMTTKKTQRRKIRRMNIYLTFMDWQNSFAEQKKTTQSGKWQEIIMTWFAVYW